MTTELVKVEPKAMIIAGRKALTELTRLIKDRPDKVVIKGKQYLELVKYTLPCRECLTGAILPIKLLGVSHAN